MFSAVSSRELSVTDSLDIHIWSIAHYTLRFLFNLDHLVDLLGDSKFGLKSREVFFQFIEILFNTFQVLIKIILYIKSKFNNILLGMLFMSILS